MSAAHGNRGTFAVQPLHQRASFGHRDDLEVHPEGADRRIGSGQSGGIRIGERPRLVTRGPEAVDARVHVIQSTPEQQDEGLEIVRDQLLPWLRDSSGYRGLIRLADRAGGKTLVVTLWADQASLQASAEAGNRLTELTMESVGATRLALEQYEATLFDV